MALRDRVDSWNIRHGHKLKIDNLMSLADHMDKMAEIFEREVAPSKVEVNEYDFCMWGKESGTLAEMEKKMIEQQGEHVGRSTVQMLKSRMEETKLNLIIQSIDVLIQIEKAARENQGKKCQCQCNPVPK